MVIDNKQLKEIYVPKVRPPRGTVCEHFYRVPNTDDYVLSDHGRLYRWCYTWTSKGGYNKVKPSFNSTLGEETYKIHFIGKDEETEIPVRKLIAIVFYGNIKKVYLYNPRYNLANPLRWSIYNLHVLTSQEEIAEAYLSKMEHRVPAYDKTKIGCTFINRFDNGNDFRIAINKAKSNVLTRGININYKKRFPQYADCSVDDELRHSPIAFGQWYLDNLYDYPKDLEIDKDLLGFGEKNHYSTKYMTFIPTYINLIFTERRSKLGYSINTRVHSDGTVHYWIPGHAFQFNGFRPSDYTSPNFKEVLVTARKMKADYIRRIAEKERNDGYIPSHILDAMEKWADLCEQGLIKKWEPAAHTLVEMGVI